MTVAELIAALVALPPEAEVYYTSGPYEGQVFAEEIDPSPTLERDGRVLL